MDKIESDGFNNGLLWMRELILVFYERRRLFSQASNKFVKPWRSMRVSVRNKPVFMDTFWQKILWKDSLLFQVW